MKKRLIVVIVFLLGTGLLAADDNAKFAITRAPVTPRIGFADVRSWGTDLQVYYLTKKVDSLDFSINYMGAAPIFYEGSKKFGYSFTPSIGVLWADGDMFDSFSGLSLGFDLSFGGVVVGDPQGNNLVLFGGGKTMLPNYMEYESGSASVTMVNILYGLNAGVKGKYRLAPTFALVPFYTFDMNAGYYKVDTIIDMPGFFSSTTAEDTIPFSSSHLFGLDILFGNYSLGALLDLGDDDGYTFSLNFRIPLMKPRPVEKRK